MESKRKRKRTSRSKAEKRPKQYGKIEKSAKIPDHSGIDSKGTAKTRAGH